MSSLSKDLPIGKWVEEWNNLVFYQPSNDLSSKTLSENLDPNIVVKINHTTHDIAGLKAGVTWVRSSFLTTLNSNEELLVWDAPDGVGGAVVYKTEFTSKELVSGKVVRKVSLVMIFVRGVEGKRKVSELG